MSREESLIKVVMLYRFPLRMTARSAWIFYGIAIGIAVVIATLFSPGFISYDSLSQYRQVVGDLPLNDGHPVIMAYVWRAMLALTGAPGSMLLFQQLTYWLVLAIFASQIYTTLRSKVFILLMIGLCPPLLITSLHIWKDVGMMTALALASVALYACAKRVRFAWLVAAFFALLYASAIRINGLIPALVIWAGFSYLASTTLSPARYKRAFLGVLLFLSYPLTHVTVMNRLNTGLERTFSLGVLITWDIISVSLLRGEDLVPPYLARTSTSATLLKDLAAANSRNANVPSFSVVSPFPEPRYQQQLLRDWAHVVWTYPKAYLRHRLHVFMTLLGIKSKTIYYPHSLGIESNTLGLEFAPAFAPVVAYSFKIFDFLTNTIFYRPWIYVILSLVPLFSGARLLARRKSLSRIQVASVAISLSGLANLSALFFIATAADYRYVTWTIFAGLLSFIIFLKHFTHMRKI